MNFTVVMMSVFVIIFYIVKFLFTNIEGTKKSVASFEKGFMSTGKIQISFSVHFFLIMIIFIIFDLEIVLMLGLVIMSPFGFLISVLLWAFVMGGLYLEWAFGKLSWMV